MNWMIYLILGTMVLVVVACCDTPADQVGEHQPVMADSLSSQIHTEMETIYFQQTENIEFDFTLRKLNPYKEIYEVEAIIINHNDHPVYFKTRTCYELQGDFVFDKAKFSLCYSTTCRSSFAVINELAPNAKLVYVASITNFTKARSLQLGLNFYAVSKPAKATGETQPGINYDLVTKEVIRTEKFIDYEQKWEFRNDSDRQTPTVIWAKEKSIL